MDSEFTRLVIRHRIVDRRLPHGAAVNVSEGPGDGRRCDGCAESIMPNQSAIWATVSEWMFVRLHAECFEIWNSERLAVSPVKPREPRAMGHGG